MGKIALLFWLFGALVTDILSLIPYVGIIFSWPFALFFGIYKISTGQRLSTLAFTVGDFMLEGLLSTIPANTIDVILTYLMGKSSKINL